MMLVTGQIDEVRAMRRALIESSWGLVPTMGYLHEGHRSLVKRAKEDNDLVGVSIFVNPTQFSPSEDFSSYPRDLNRDIDLLKSEKVDLVFVPSDVDIYPANFQSEVSVDKLSGLLEGAARPGHFRGVTTIVAKLLNIFQPTRVYFGQKDAQQTVVIGKMLEDLNFPVELVTCPIIRERDGVAMSSRNVRLTPDQRRAAPVLFRALSAAQESFHSGVADANKLRKLMEEIIQREPLARLDYVSIADPTSLDELEQITSGALFSLAVFFGAVRLIDNILIKLEASA